MERFRFGYLINNHTVDHYILLDILSKYGIIGTLWDSYINDLAGVSENIFVILFADDTTVLIEGTYLYTMITSLNCELAQLTEWLNAKQIIN